MVRAAPRVRGIRGEDEIEESGTVTEQETFTTHLAFQMGMVHMFRNASMSSPLRYR